MKTKLLLYFIPLFLFFSPLHAQIKCGFEAKMEQYRKENPGFEKEINRQVREFILTQKSERGRINNTLAAIYYIPVVVHVIHTGGAVGTIYNPADANITGAIDYLNAVYDGTWTGSGGSILGVGDIQIKFVLATKDPANNATTGIDRVNGSGLANYTASGVFLGTAGAPETAVKDLSRWDPTRYYNIWVVNKIDGADGTVGAFIAGFAYFPWPNNTLPSTLRTDGTIMLATQMNAGAKTLPHEIGHAFNLYHPFEGEVDIAGPNTCPANGTPSVDGDACTDTDPVINPADDSYGGSAFGCRTGVNSCNGAVYNNNTESNFMNYTNCYRLFTSDQKTRMLAAAANSTRNGLATSWANNQGTYPTTWIPPVAAAITPVCALNNSNALGIMNISMSGNKIFSLNATQDGGYVDNVKWYNLFEFQVNTTYGMTIGLNNSGNNEQVGVWIDYDGNGSFNNTNERVFFTTNNPPSSILNISFTTPAFLSGSIVRMRIMNDFSTIYGTTALSGSSASIFAGQVEDYPVFLKTAITLPLVLTEFNGYTNNRNNYLTWKTSLQTNTKAFDIQRSINGSDFITIATVAAKTNTTNLNDYHFTDNHFGSGSYVYKLKMIDKNGTFAYSNGVTLKMETPVKTLINGNPFTNNIQMLLPGHTGNATVRLLDALGRIVIEKNIMPGQSNLVDIQVSPFLTRGIYMLETIINKQSSVSKLIKQ